MAEESVGRVVVGIDGSEQARSALDWAAGEARLRSWALVAVHAYTIPPYLLAPEPVPLGVVPPDPGLLEQLDATAQKLVAEELERVASDDLTVDGRVVSGPAADALLRAAEEGDLLVVGSRGLGGFKGLLMGSVSHQVAQHAPCPVVIVPTEERD